MIGLHYRRLLVRQLFASDDTNELLNKAALRFFTTLKWDLLDTIVIAISRLTDPAISFKRFNNASLQQLIDSLDASAYSELIHSLNNIHTQIKAKSVRVENWRKKWTAHRDLEVVQSVSPKPAMSLVEVDKVLELIGKFLNEFEHVCQDRGVEPAEEFTRRASESERLRIYPPIPYENRHFLPDDGNTIIELVKKAISCSGQG